MTASERCPCGSGVFYGECCEPFLLEADCPSSPEQLMRSRYTAFYKGSIDYLIATQCPSRRRDDDRATLAQTLRTTKWHSLRVLRTEQRTLDKGIVEFAAFYQDESDVVSQLHERSAFLRKDGRWYYLQGEMLPPIVLGRNDACWCGSGKKLKNCHGS